MPDPSPLRGVIETVKAIDRGTLTAEQAVRDCLDRIEAQEPGIGAWVAVDEKGAIDAARTLDRGPMRGPLHGVALAVKDIVAVQDLPWRCGSPIWADRIAGFDAGSVALARNAGAVILGKTETTEFANSHPSRTRNPFDPARTPGGSSSGSAAAVACGMAPLAFGTQTAGSVIRPASFCGVVGYKPSFDLIETGGVAPLARSLDTVGVFTRSVPDAALAVGALSGLDLMPAPDFAPTDLALLRTPFWDRALPELVSAWEAFEDRLRRRLPCDDQRFAPEVSTLLPGAQDLHLRIMARESSESLAHEYRIAPDALSDSLRAQIEGGAAQPPEVRARDRSALQDLRALFHHHLSADAVWLTPAAPGTAPMFEDGTGDPVFNRLWTLLGLPCCTVPLLTGPEGHPIGVQVVGAMGNDRGVLRLADWLMRSL